MINVKIKAEASRIDYHGIIKLIKEKFNAYESKTKRLAFKIIDTKPAKGVLFLLISAKPINKFICNKISEFVKKHMSVDINTNTLNLISKGETMKISLDCSIDNLNDVLSFIETVVKCKDKNLKAIIISSINAIKDIVDDNSKLKILNRVLNDSNEEICRYLSELISKKAFEIQIENMNFEPENNI